MVTHYGGVPCDMTEIINYCNLRNIKVIEDSACALTASVNGNNCGTLGDFGVWSFDAMKLITTGDGGALYAKDKKALSKIREYLYLGLPEKEKSGLDSAKNANEPGWWQYELNNAGRRAIMNDVAAAMGVVQMKKLHELIRSRKDTAAMYDQQIQILRLSECISCKECRRMSYFYTIKCERDELAIHLKNNGVYTIQVFVGPFIKFPSFRKSAKFWLVIIQKNFSNVSEHPITQ